jgi:hypothetical protein
MLVDNLPETVAGSVMKLRRVCLHSDWESFIESALHFPEGWI